MSDWDGAVTDWEIHCGALLRYRYDPVNVQAVPAVEGDLGLDYWIRGSGEIYQCYSTVYGDSIKERLRLQKKKLGNEVRKLIDNADRIATLITPAKCSRYIFLVPRHDSKELLEYAGTKSNVIRQAELSFCAGDFEIAVQDQDDFVAERKKLQSAGLITPRLEQVDPSDKAVHDWLSDNGQLARTIREKVEAARPSRAREHVDDLVHETVSNYLRGEDAMAKLQRQYPEIYEKTRRMITTRSHRLRAIGGMTGAVPGDTLVTELDELAAGLSAPAVGIEAGDAMILSTGAIARWLADCTLDPR